MFRKAQVWSIDVILAIVIFGFIMVAVASFALLERPDAQSLQRDAQFISAQLSGTPIPGCPGTLVVGNTIDEDVLKCLLGREYSTVKQNINPGTDFCLFFEDERGQIILLTRTDGNTTYGFGSSSVSLSGHPCGENIS